MVHQLSRKVKLVLLILAGMVIGGAAILYQKFFGGEAQFLPSGTSVVGQPLGQPHSNQEVVEKKAAVVYAQTPAEGVRQVIAQTGDLDFIQPGQKILIKPNVNSDDPAPGTAHPEAVAEVVRQVKSKGAYVVIGDRSNRHWRTIPAMKTIGLYQAVQEAGADEIIGFEDEEWVRVAPEEAKSWPKGFRVPKRLAEFDHIISVPVLHTHSITGHSLALKNLVGLIHPDDRMVFHASPKRDEMITEISLAVKPSLTIIEGTKAFIAGGPSQGTLAEPRVYLASKDILTAEIFGVNLLNRHGAQLVSWDSRQVKRAVDLSLGRYTREEIQEEWESV